MHFFLAPSLQGKIQNLMETITPLARYSSSNILALRSLKPEVLSSHPRACSFDLTAPAGNAEVETRQRNHSVHVSALGQETMRRDARMPVAKAGAKMILQ